jgi:pyruvate carboxylase
MAEKTCPLSITDVVLYDAQQPSRAAWRLEDILPVAEKLDRVGFWALDVGSAAAFDAETEEDHWARLRGLKAAMPHTPLLMSLQRQQPDGNGAFEHLVERARAHGVDVFRLYDAANDPRHLGQASRAVQAHEGHAQGCLLYTHDPAFSLEHWLNLADDIASMGVDSLIIQDTAGELKPYVAYELISRLKARLDIPIHLSCSARAGLASATLLKAAEAGADGVDGAILPAETASSHSASGAVIAMLEGSDRDTALDLALVDDIAAYFALLYQHDPDAEESGEIACTEPDPAEDKPVEDNPGASIYTVTVNGAAYVVEVAEGGDITQVQQQGASTPVPAASSGARVEAPLAGSVIQVNVKPGDQVAEGDVVLLLEAMKMETEVRAAEAGAVSRVNVVEGDSVAVGDALIVL